MKITSYQQGCPHLSCKWIADEPTALLSDGKLEREGGMNGDFVSSGMRLVGFELLELGDMTRVSENSVDKALEN